MTYQISIPSVPLSTTDLIVCGLAVTTAAALIYLVRAVCGMCERRP
jgi:hypothetical protein